MDSLPPSHTRIADRYWRRSRTPWASLVFLLPLIVFYEIGTLIYATDHASGITHYVYARSLLRDFFELFGVTGYYLPGLIVVVVLGCWHVARRDPWKIEPTVYMGMLLESLAWAAPPFVFMVLLTRQPVEAAGWTQVAAEGASAWSGAGPGLPLQSASGDTGWRAQLVFSIGAGIYEELLFRLILIALLHMIAVDLLALPQAWGAVLAIGLSAVAFSFYHFSEQNRFTPGLFAFYTLAGIYLAAVYVIRGFGIVAGTHAMYDVFVVMLNFAGPAAEA